VTDLLGVRPERIRFVDDGADNVDAANRRGWTAAEYHQLSDLGDLLG
jgi:FMN phosphatase YigB (HAD superfamily)